ncbi:hypothetical protein ACLMJK_005731 [Lecanora helva]
MSTDFSTPKRPLIFLITGCSSGFGLSLARIVQAGGHTVIATSRNPSKTPDLVEEVKSHGGQWIGLDVDDRSSSRVIKQLEDSGVEIDILVNNAGYSIFAPVEISSEDEIRAQMETMYFGPLRLIRAVLPHMRKRKFGVIVNMSSGAALEARESMGPYAGAKAGLDALTKVLAKEVAPFNIRALTVVLGTFNTDMPMNALYGTNPMGDYAGSMTDQIIKVIQSGKMPSYGDKDKAMKAVYEVVTGTGVGAGKESERLLVLGSDMVQRVLMVQNYLQRGLDAFGDVANSVGVEK